MKILNKKMFLGVSATVFVIVVSAITIVALNSYNPEPVIQIDTAVKDLVTDSISSAKSGDIEKAKTQLSEAQADLRKAGIGINDPIPAEYGVYEAQYLIDNYNEPTTAVDNGQANYILQIAPQP